MKRLRPLGRTRLLAAALCVAPLACGNDGDSHSIPSNTASTATAVYGGATDANTAEANVVVQLQTAVGGCTGTLITPALC